MLMYLYCVNELNFHDNVPNEWYVKLLLKWSPLTTKLGVEYVASCCSLTLIQYQTAWCSWCSAAICPVRSGHSMFRYLAWMIQKIKNSLMKKKKEQTLELPKLKINQFQLFTPLIAWQQANHIRVQYTTLSTMCIYKCQRLEYIIDIEKKFQRIQQL